MEYVPRLIEPTVRNYLSSKPQSILLITGAPQVGKTRIIEHTLEQTKEKRISLNLRQHTHFLEQIESCSTFKKFRKLMEEEYRFFPQTGTILFIDDIQASDVLATFIPHMTDAWNGCPIILCGTLLPEAYNTILSENNRFISHHVIRPYQFSEFLKANQKRSLSRHVEHGKTSIFEDRHNRLIEWLERYLEVGGIPEVVDWASHGEDFSFHLDEIIMENNKRIEDLAGKHIQLAVDNSLRALVKKPMLCLSNNLKSVLKRWDIILNTNSDPEQNIIFDIGISHQYKQRESPNFWDGESGDPAAVALITECLVIQTSLALCFQKANMIPHDKATADFIIAVHDQMVPITCKMMFSSNPDLIDEAFQALERVPSVYGVIITLTPFEVINKGDKRLLLVPLYLVETLVDIIKRCTIEERSENYRPAGI